MIRVPMLLLIFLLLGLGLSEGPAVAGEPVLAEAAGPGDFGPRATPTRDSLAEVPPLMAEGSNSCEIVSCGMGLKDTCKITCPADKTPKCSCDCAKSFGPMCTEYKANCRCE
ncbi:MAG TPA: hypothetical protein VFS39_04845 [Nitrospira sp.]|nr:hypothetical protein [Nitrospira sp.]